MFGQVAKRGLWALALTLLPLSSLAQIPKVDVLFVGAHPDDDSVATATLARLVRGGKKVAVVCATRGEKGGNSAGRERGAALGILRETEQRAVLGQLGIHQLYYLERVDSGFTTSVEVSEHNWNHAKTLERLVRFIRILRPETVITMNPVPRGHGDHQLIARLTSEAFEQAGQKDAMLEAEALQPWRARKLYYSLEYGAEGLEPSVEIPTGEFAQVESKALQLYRSQGWDKEMPPQRDRESFILGVDRAPANHALGGEERPIFQPPAPAPDRIELETIPSVSEFRRWATRWHLTHLLRQTPAELVLARGRKGFLQGYVRGRKNATIELQGHVTRAVQGQKFGLPVQAGGSIGAFPLHISATLPIGPATLKVVPLLGDESWQEIPKSNVWEGKNLDCSARFRLLLRSETLHIEVEVRDRDVVSNLAADDNRDHWRSDSVEICIDPSGHSPNTLSTFKLGIAPFNTEGRPMANRDADAHPGPASRGIQISSKRTPGGYWVQADIKRAEIGPLAEEFGLNVIIYDVERDGSGARLAWSPWETVQGTPRLWGRARLKHS